MLPKREEERERERDRDATQERGRERERDRDATQGQGQASGQFWLGLIQGCQYFITLFVLFTWLPTL